jgi:hypothetical protein
LIQGGSDIAGGFFKTNLMGVSSGSDSKRVSKDRMVFKGIGGMDSLSNAINQKYFYWRKETPDPVTKK